MQKFLEDRHRQFWLLHTFGWLGFALVAYLGSLLHEMRDAYLIVVALDAYAGWLLTIPLRYLYQRTRLLHPAALLSSALFASFCTAVVWAVVKSYNYWEIYRHGFPNKDIWRYFEQTPVAFYVMLCWSGLYFGIRYYQSLQQEKQKLLTESSKAHESQLKMLRYQLNPHFLFNTLNAISTLVMLGEGDTANKMLTRLSDFLRYSLYKDPIKKVPLQQEIHAASLYLEIEKVRFAERLHIEYDIAENTSEALVPSLILQPLIENAIKYAVARQSCGGHIAIRARKFGHDLLIEVADNGPGMPIDAGLPKENSGLGLVNTKDRLAALYDQNFSLVLTHNQPQGVKVNIRIPFEVEPIDEKLA